MLDPRRLLTFREVARQGSFSRAAEVLALSQPAVSQQIGALERELGTELLVRGRAGATPTPAGELLLTHADALAAQLDRADAQMGELVAGEHRTLRVGAFPSAMATIVPAAVEAACTQNPGLEVTIEEGGEDERVAGVLSGTMHLAVCFQDASDPPREYEGLRRVDLGEEPMVALLPADHRLAGQEEIDLRELADEPWMAPSPDGILITACRAAGFEPRIVIFSRDPLAARAFAAAGLAVSLTPELIGWLPMPGVVMPAVRNGPRRSLYVILPPAGAHPLTGALVDELADAFSRPQPAA
jgi:DNA-binding transcriptional LysR family regulator